MTWCQTLRFTKTVLMRPRCFILNKRHIPTGTHKIVIVHARSCLGAREAQHEAVHTIAESLVCALLVVHRNIDSMAMQDRMVFHCWLVIDLDTI